MMKLKNFDIMISRRLPSIIPSYNILFEDRLTSEGGLEMTTKELPILIKGFLDEQEVLKYDKFPEVVMTYLREFYAKENKDITQGDIQNLFSIMEYNQCPFKIIGRLDLSEPGEMPQVDQRAYLVNNYQHNASATCGVYHGYAMNYNALDVPVGADFMHVFNLSDAQLEDFDLDIAMKTYEAFKQNGTLNRLDDTKFLAFFMSRGMKYFIERH